MIVIEGKNTHSRKFNGDALDHSAILDTITIYCLLYSSYALAFEPAPMENFSDDFCV